MYTLAEKLKCLRKRKKLSQEKVAHYLNMSQSAIGHHETNKKKPSRETIRKYAELYDVSIDYLLGTSDEIVTYTVQESKLNNYKTNQLLTKEDLKKNFKLMVGDKEATDEEIEEAIRYIMIQRMMKKNLE